MAKKGVYDFKRISFTKACKIDKHNPGFLKDWQEAELDSVKKKVAADIAKRKKAK